MKKYICLHGHFYQPPRENPWTGKIEKQNSASPYRDWNERITAECYSPNSQCEIIDRQKKIVNNYSWISFNFGPTLLSWMETNAKQAYHRILQADKLSVEHFGHGSALAQVYNHIIMPLASEKDKETQVIWGIQDFKYRFQRLPQGMWLAETAVDLPTLEILAKHGITFTILAPRQARQVKKINEKQWHNVNNANISPFQPYVCKLPSGKTITLFFYDGPVSQDIAFNNLLANGEQFANRLLDIAFHQPHAPIVHVATDGETYGHHHKFGDRSLGYCLNHITKQDNIELTIYSAYLAKYPPQHEVEIFENSSWSCVHGIERWRSNCGCGTGHQQWRTPLREAMDWLRDECYQIYENQTKKYKINVWELRNNYIDVILGKQDKDSFFRTHLSKSLRKSDKNKIFDLLEMQHYSLLMYTSCGWFFDKISRLEGVQIMAYAARCIELAQKYRFLSLEKRYLKILEKAKSNISSFKNGADVYNKLVKTMPKN